MANWNTLKTAVADVINANGNQAITGQLLQNVLNNIITNVGENATFAGIATLDTNPGAPDGPVFYLTATVGTYPNFNGIEVQDGEAVILLWNNNAWSKKVTGFATQEKLSQLGSKASALLMYNQDGNQSNLKVDGHKIIVHPDGFGVKIGGKIYYIATTIGRTENYEFNLAELSCLCIDTTKLTNVGARNEPKDVLTIVPVGNMDGLRYIPIAYNYPAAQSAVLIGEALDLWGIKSIYGDIENLKEAESLLVYPYSDKKFTANVQDNSVVLDFTGLNIKFNGISYEKTKADVIAEIGQTGDFVIIGDSKGLFFDVTKKQFKLGSATIKSDVNIPLLIHHGLGTFSYVSPSLSDYLFATKKELDGVKGEVSRLYSIASFSLMYNSDGYQSNLKIDGHKIIINPYGFGVKYNGDDYYIATTSGREENYEFEMTTLSYFCVDTTKLTNIGGRVEPTDALAIVSVNSMDYSRYIPIVYNYPAAASASFVGEAFDLWGEVSLQNKFNSALNKANSLLVYPYSDRKLSYEFQDDSVILDFTGFNIKFNGESLAKTKEEIIDEVGQDGEYLIIGDSKGLFFDVEKTRFKIGTNSILSSTNIPILIHHRLGTFSYVSPSLSDYLFASKKEASNASGGINVMLMYNKDGYQRNLNIDGHKIIIHPDGFGVKYNGNNYYIATTSSKTENYEFELTSLSYFCIDTEMLTNVEGRVEPTDALVIIPVDSMDFLRYAPIAYNYPAASSASLLGQAFDLWGAPSIQKEIQDISYNQAYNDTVLFSPSFYAYRKGRRNNDSGVGTGWYSRFTIGHISDTHGYYSLVEEAVSVMSKKADVIVNTGDDGDGSSSSDANDVISSLTKTMNVVNGSCKLPYLEVKGNHDVTGLTRKQYFDIVCNTVQKFTTDVVWGDKDNNCSYGYADFTDSSYEGNFRLIMLDPFDYEDGLFESIYSHQCAVFSQKQIDWLISALIDAASKGLKVITMMHYSFGDNPIFDEEKARPDATFYQDPFMIPDIIDAIQKRTSLNKMYSDSAGINNITINRDFSGIEGFEFVAHLFGHIHSKNDYRCQKTDGSKVYDILMLGEAAIGTYGNALNKAYRYSGTINAIAFSSISIDPVEKAIYRVAYGAFLNYDNSNDLTDRVKKISYTF